MWQLITDNCFCLIQNQKITLSNDKNHEGFLKIYLLWGTLCVYSSHLYDKKQFLRKLISFDSHFEGTVHQERDGIVTEETTISVGIDCFHVSSLGSRESEHHKAFSLSLFFFFYSVQDLHNFKENLLENTNWIIF